MNLAFEKWKPATWLALILSVGIAAYSNIFNAPFIFDDTEAIVNNPNIHSLWPIWKTLIPPPFETALAWRPFISFSFAVNYAISGANPWSYHALNLMTHLGASALLFLIIAHTIKTPLKTSIAGLTALLFVLHPIQTEAVTYTIKRTELFMSFFYLLTLYSTIRYSDQTNGTFGKWFWIAVVSCACGMGSKQGMITAPIMIAIYDRIFLSSSFVEIWNKRRIFYASLILTSIVIVLAAFAAPPVQTAGFHLNLVSPIQYAATEWRAIWHYIRLAFWPNPLILDYDWFIYKNPAANTIYGIGIFALLSLTAVMLKKKPAFGFLGVWFFLSLAPTSSIMPITTEVIAEHRMYLPVISLILLITLSASRTKRYFKWLGWILIGIAVAFGFLTFKRNQDYHSEVNIWEVTTAQNPTRSRPFTSLGTAYGKAKRHEEALKTCLHATEINPYDYEAFNCAGAAYMNLDQNNRALEYFLKTIDLKPIHQKAYENLIFVYGKSGNPKKAIEIAEKALTIMPPSKALLYNLGVAHLHSGNQEKAYQLFKQTAELDPTFLNARETLALFEMEKKKLTN